MKKLILFMVFTSISLAGCKTFEQSLIEKGYRNLHGDELTKTFVGNTDFTSSGEYWYYGEDGRIVGISKSGRDIDGKWTLNDAGTICIDWDDVYLPSGCSKYFINDQTKEIVWLEPDGQNSKTDIKKGNPKNFK